MKRKVYTRPEAIPVCMEAGRLSVVVPEQELKIRSGAVEVKDFEDVLRGIPECGSAMTFE